MFLVTSTHTFTSEVMEDQRFETAGQAWRAVGIDYLQMDAGLPAEQQEQDGEALYFHADEPGTVTLLTGEEITVSRAEED